MKKFFASACIFTLGSQLFISNTYAENSTLNNQKNFEGYAEKSGVNSLTPKHLKLKNSKIELPNLNFKFVADKMKSGDYYYQNDLALTSSRNNVIKLLGSPKNISIGKKDFGSNYTFVQDYYGKNNELIVTYFNNKKNSTDSRLKAQIIYFNYENVNLYYKDINKNLGKSDTEVLEKNNTTKITDDTLYKYYGKHLIIKFDRPNKNWKVNEIYLNK